MHGEAVTQSGNIQADPLEILNLAPQSSSDVTHLKLAV